LFINLLSGSDVVRIQYDTLLGQGGFGSVYLGTTAKGVSVAVKQLAAVTHTFEMSDEIMALRY
jgi:hypothetical protein